jgi:hypothetical protein
MLVAAPPIATPGGVVPFSLPFSLPFFSRPRISPLLSFPFFTANFLHRLAFPILFLAASLHDGSDLDRCECE